MVANVVAPSRVALLVLSCNPRLASCVEQVLSAEDIGHEEELWILDGAVNVALCCEVDNEIEVILLEELFHQFLVTYVAAMEETTLVVNILSDGLEVACIGQCVENNHTDVAVVL